MVTAPFMLVHLDVPPSMELLDSKQTAERLGVTVNNLRQMVFKGKLQPVQREGKRLMFDSLTVNLLAEQRKTRSERDAQQPEVD